MKRFWKLEPWRKTLYIMFVVQLVAAIGFSTIFPFFPLYVKALGTHTNLSLEFWSGAVFSSQAITMMFASPVWGAMADRYGRKMMVSRAAFGGAFIILLMGFVGSAEELTLLRAIQGFVTGTVPASNALVAATVPRERSGFAMGMMQMGQWTGIAIGPLIGGFIADSWGFRAAFVVTAVLLFLSGLLVTWGIEEKFQAKSQTKKITFFMAEWRDILLAPSVGLIYLARLLSWLGRTMLIPVIPLFVVTLLPDSDRISTFTGLVVGIAAATGTASAVYLGRLGDRIGHRRVLIASATLGGFFYMAQVFTTEAWQLLVLQALAGAASGGVIPSISALLNTSTQPGQEGSVYGLDSSVAAAARAVAPMVGAGIAVWFGMPGAFVLAGLIFLGTAGLALRWLPEVKAAPARAPVA